MPESLGPDAEYVISKMDNHDQPKDQSFLKNKEIQEELLAEDNPISIERDFNGIKASYDLRKTKASKIRSVDMRGLVERKGIEYDGNNLVYVVRDITLSIDDVQLSINDLLPPNAMLIYSPDTKGANWFRNDGVKSK